VVSLSGENFHSGVRSRCSDVKAADLNFMWAQEERSEILFCCHLARKNISDVVDIGANAGQFVEKIRRHGYAGLIYSVEPLADAYARLVGNSRRDAAWIPVRRSAAGSETQSLEINVSQNSVSSSILKVHQNHIDAAPEAASTTTEPVYVQKTAELLPAHLRERRFALKIDVQGYEKEVLEGLGDLVKNIDLLMLEMSLVPCYHGAPEFEDLYRYLVDDLGLTCIALEPSYYDVNNVSLQQVDGLFARGLSATDAVAPACGVLPEAVVSSMGPRIEREGLDLEDVGEQWQSLACASWSALGCEVISVSEHPPAVPGLEWHQTESRPTINEILRFVAGKGYRSTVLVNSDICLSRDFSTFVRCLDPDVLYYGCRTEVQLLRKGSSEARIGEVYPYGYDFFVVPLRMAETALGEMRVPDGYAIGLPWWDYCLPILGMAQGVPIKRLPNEARLAFHHVHPRKFTLDSWRCNGARFIQWTRWLSEKTGYPLADLLGTVDVGEGALDADLQKVCDRILAVIP
jgi:FkbM family methyltransferase